MARRCVFRRGQEDKLHGNASDCHRSDTFARRRRLVWPRALVLGPPTNRWIGAAVGTSAGGRDSRKVKIILVVSPSNSGGYRQDGKCRLILKR